MESVLVIGAAPQSLGHHIQMALSTRGCTDGEPRYNVTTAGVSGHESYPCDITNHWAVRHLMETTWDHVICTAGINLDGNAPDFLEQQLKANVMGPAILLTEWVNSDVREIPGRHHFVSVSSNSAHRPRSRSAGYCASKAALSMYMRSVARAWQGSNMIISVLEPGWIQGTPMSKEVAKRFEMEDEGLDPGMVADHVVDVLGYGPEWNGVTLRLDNGET